MQVGLASDFKTNPMFFFWVNPSTRKKWMELKRQCTWIFSKCCFVLAACRCCTCTAAPTENPRLSRSKSGFSDLDCSGWWASLCGTRDVCFFERMLSQSNTFPKKQAKYLTSKTKQYLPSLTNNCWLFEKIKPPKCLISPNSSSPK